MLIKVNFHVFFECSFRTFACRANIIQAKVTTSCKCMGVYISRQLSGAAPSAVVKVEGAFLWHRHADTDETFIVLEGELRIDVRAGPAGDTSMVQRAGRMAVVPKGVAWPLSASATGLFCFRVAQSITRRHRRPRPFGRGCCRGHSRIIRRPRSGMLC
jgi:hypothetical protein